MMIQSKHIAILLVILFGGCNSKQLNNQNRIVKTHDSDKFKNTIVESNFYMLDTKDDNTIATGKGNLLIIPTGSLLDEKGKIVQDSVQIELAEGSDIDEIILSNLTIQDTSLMYESYLSFFINATRKGKQLHVNPNNPIYFEIAADKQVKLYKGFRDHFGNMTWKKDKSPIDYLIPVSLDLLNFYPDGFELEVEKGLPFRNHKYVTTELLDSLYYSFSTELDTSGYFNWSGRLCMINLVIPILNLLAQDEPVLNELEPILNTEESIWGINPASIKAIRSKKFQNTLISTREFEYRLKAIFATCDNKILELYINNLNKNLWEIDEMAAKQLGAEHSVYQKFVDFASYKQTTVKLSDRKAKILAKHYEESKEKIEKQLLRFKQKHIQKNQKLEQISQKKKEEYRKLLEARHSYRMKKFGFELSNFGWYNAAHEIKLTEIEKFTLKISIKDGIHYDRVYSYVVNPKINSIFSCLSTDKQSFNFAYFEDPNLLLWKNQEFNIIGVGYLDDSIGYDIKEYIQTPTINADLQLVNIGFKEFKNNIKKLSKGYSHENKILVDLEYQAFFYSEKKREEKKQKDLKYINNLRKKVFPCWLLSSIVVGYEVNSE